MPFGAGLVFCLYTCKSIEKRFAKIKLKLIIRTWEGGEKLDDTEKLLDTAAKLVGIAAGLITIAKALKEQKRRPRNRKPRKQKR